MQQVAILKALPTARRWPADLADRLFVRGGQWLLLVLLLLAVLLPLAAMLWRGSTETWSRRATHCQVSSRARPIIRPGKMPARNSLPIDTLAITPNTMRPMEGGITGAITPPAAIRPAERGTL